MATEEVSLHTVNGLLGTFPFSENDRKHGVHKLPPPPIDPTDPTDQAHYAYGYLVTTEKFKELMQHVRNNMVNGSNHEYGSLVFPVLATLAKDIGFPYGQELATCEVDGNKCIVFKFASSWDYHETRQLYIPNAVIKKFRERIGVDGMPNWHKVHRWTVEPSTFGTPESDKLQKRFVPVFPAVGKDGNIMGTECECFGTQPSCICDSQTKPFYRAYSLVLDKCSVVLSVCPISSFFILSLVLFLVLGYLYLWCYCIAGLIEERMR